MGDDDDDEIHLHVTYASHFDMDEAFCARMLEAIEAGLESALIGVVTTPGTRHPKYVATKQVARFSQALGPNASQPPNQNCADDNDKENNQFHLSVASPNPPINPSWP
jgi:hypothetical protein